MFSFLQLTPPSVAVYAVLFVCKNGSEASMHTNRHRVHRRLEGFVERSRYAAEVTIHN